MADERIMDAIPLSDEEESFELASLDSQTRQGFAVTNIKEDLTRKGVSYCSMQAASMRDKVSLYNAISKPKKIQEVINCAIRLAHIYIDAITITDQNTGEVVTAPRIVLIDDKATGYQSVSAGMYDSVKRLIQMFGEPDSWQKPLTVKVIPVSLKNGGHTYNLEAVFE